LCRSEAAEESIYDGACVKQVFQGAQRGDLFCRDATRRLHGGRNLGPIGRNERFTSVGQDQQEIQPTVPMGGLKNSERFTFEWMTPANNLDFLGKVLMMGSVSWCPSIEFRMTN